MWRRKKMGMMVRAGLIEGLRKSFSTGADFPQGTLGKTWNLFWWSQVWGWGGPLQVRWGNTTDIQWMEALDGTKHPTMHRPARPKTPVVLRLRTPTLRCWAAPKRRPQDQVCLKLQMSPLSKSYYASTSLIRTRKTSRIPRIMGQIKYFVCPSFTL